MIQRFLFTIVERHIYKYNFDREINGWMKNLGNGGIVFTREFSEYKERIENQEIECAWRGGGACYNKLSASAPKWGMKNDRIWFKPTTRVQTLKRCIIKRRITLLSRFSSYIMRSFILWKLPCTALMPHSIF